ncbi:MAG: hypothetical protein Q9186_006224 [Xanthomendoza sp. 1 TL-2023]
MKTGSLSSLTLHLRKVSSGSTFLPFLYQTRTIQFPAALSPRASHSFHTTGVRIAKRDRYSDPIPFETEIRPRGDDDHFREIDEESAGYDPFAQHVENDANRPLRNSTITASEKAVFERIFKEISDDASKQGIKEEDPLESNLEDDERSQGDGYSDLSAIFDDAIRRTALVREESSNEDRDKYHPDYISRNFRSALEAFAGTGKRTMDMSIWRSDENFKKIQASIVENNRRVTKRINQAKTDAEIWNVLETEVFSLIQQYESQRKEAEEREEPQQAKRKGGRVSKADKEAAAAAEKSQSLRAREKSFREAEIQGILSSNYGDYCLAALRRLRRAYPTSPYSMNLLPTVKRLGSISHVLAASVDLYNEVLFLLWSEYSDLHGMADLIIEMGNQGIESNETTLRILRMAQIAKTRAIREDKPIKLWWSLSPVQAGWTRVKGVAQKVHYEIVQAKARRAIDGARGGAVDGGELHTEEDSSRETSTEEEPRVKRAVADEAIISL